jgi:hypothetical protein
MGYLRCENCIHPRRTQINYVPGLTGIGVVAKGLGLGLDEKAIEAVRRWRLQPALGPDRRPAAVRQIIEVTFQLY